MEDAYLEMRKSQVEYLDESLLTLPFSPERLKEQGSAFPPNIEKMLKM
jgi:hypothetical protein